MTAPIAQLVTTAPTEQVADAIAAALVDERLAACVQVSGPIRSRYRWDGGIEVSTEWRLTAKTTVENVSALTARVLELHPYGVPEVLVSSVDATFAYAEWLRAEVR